MITFIPELLSNSFRYQISVACNELVAYKVLNKRLQVTYNILKKTSNLRVQQNFLSLYLENSRREYQTLTAFVAMF